MRRGASFPACSLLACLFGISLSGSVCIPPPPDCLPCKDCNEEVETLRDQAGQAPNLLIEMENGTGSGQSMPRSCASNQTTILLKRNQERSFSVTLASQANYELRLVYSNDGPGTEDQVRVTANGQSRTFRLQDTRGDCEAGCGWNYFASAGPVAPVVQLNAGENTITVEVVSADQFGVELDALLLFPAGN